MADETITEIEEWRPVEGWPYEVSNLGRVRRTGAARGARVGHIKKLTIGDHGYLVANLSKPDRPNVATCVHVLVCAAFHGPKPDWAEECRHLDGDRLNNNESNLAWGTCADNNADMLTHGTRLRGERHQSSIFSDSMVCQVRYVHMALRGTRKRVPKGAVSAMAQAIGVNRYSLINVLAGVNHRFTMYEVPTTLDHRLSDLLKKFLDE